MKKFSLILLMALLALPMMAQQKAATSKALASADRNVRVANKVSNPLKAFNWELQPASFAKADVTYEWDFEDDADYDGWKSIDADGDGNYWETDDYYGHNGPNCLLSYSWNGSAMDPDNWLISPQVPLGGVLTFWAMNYSSSYPDNIAVYVCVGNPQTTADFEKISLDITPPTAWTEYSYDLSAYAGQVGCFAIRHYNCPDNYRIYIDDISLTATVPDPVENLTVDPAATTADVAWDDAENDMWSLRYREIIPGTEDNLFWGFEEDTNGNENIELTGGWTTIDADADGNAWYHLYGDFNNHTGKGVVTSASWASSPLTPDNWLVSPEVKLDGTLSFWAAGQDPSYPAEIFAVYVNVGGDPTNPADFVLISDAELVANGEMTEYTFDLSGYEGAMGYVAIRHYNVTDMFRLNVDDIAITYVEPAEWVYVDGITSTNYTIENLTPETNYVVEVQAVTAQGATSAWSETVPFTTLAEVTPSIPNVYLLGQVGEQQWAPNVGTLMEYSEETMLYTATVTVEAGNAFGFTTELAMYDDGGSWDYIEPFRFGPESVGDFVLFPELLGTNLTLTFDSYGAVVVQETADYNVTVDLNNNIIIIDKVAPAFIRGDVDDNKVVDIADVSALIDYLLSHNAEGVNLLGADCDLNEQVDIADVSALIDYLLSHNWAD